MTKYRNARDEECEGCMSPEKVRVALVTIAILVGLAVVIIFVGL